MYLLYRMLGTSAIIGSMVCIVIMIPLQFVIGKKMSNNAEMSAVRPLYSFYPHPASPQFSNYVEKHKYQIIIII